ncbi:MAG: HgcAB-associated protein HgcC [Candidatus Poribacteria bacterium]
MSERNKNKTCCTNPATELCQCKVESVISIDDRGQMVLPKELREKANIHSGDKLAVVTWEKNNEICCITLIKVDSLANMVKDFLGPVIKDILK